MPPGRGSGAYRFVEWVNPQSTLLDADGSLCRLFHPNGFGGKHWTGSQPGQRFHDLMEQARYTLDPRRRKELYAEATQIIQHGNNQESTPRASWPPGFISARATSVSAQRETLPPGARLRAAPRTGGL